MHDSFRIQRRGPSRILGVALALACVLLSRPSFGHDAFVYIGCGWNVLDTDKPQRFRIMSDSTADMKTVENTAIGPIPRFYHYIPGSDSDYSSHYASSYTAMTRSLSVEASVEGEYGGFSGKVEGKYSNAVQTSTSAHLGLTSFSQIVGEMRFRDEDDVEKMKQNLKASFRDKLNDPQVSPETLFEDFGTHVVTRVRMGGRIDLYSESLQTESASQSEFEVAVEAKYSGAFSLKASSKVSGSSTDEQKKLDIKETIKVTGGTEGSVSAKSPVDSFSVWSKSVAGAPKVVGRPGKSLLPIWELCDTQERAAQIKKEFVRQRATFKLQNLVVFSQSWAWADSNYSGAGSFYTNYRELPALPPGYKIISGGGTILQDAATGGGASGEQCFTENYPVGENSWRVVSMFRVDKSLGYSYCWSARLGISVVAIWDPKGEEDFLVDIEKRTFNGDTAQTYDRTMNVIYTKDRYVLTGGGVKLTATPANTWGHIIYGSYPNSNGSAWIIESGADIYKGAAAQEIYAISLTTRPGVGIGIVPVVWESNGLAGSDSKIALATRDQGHILIGGGVRGDNRAARVRTSEPVMAADGRISWNVRTADIRDKGKGVATAYGIGIEITNWDAPE